MISLADQKTIKSIIILFPEFLGDFLQFVPAIHLLRQRCPRSRIVAFVTPPILELVKQHPAIDDARLIGEWNTPDGQKSLVGAIKALNADLAYFTNDQLFWIAKRAGVRHLIRERNSALFLLMCHGFRPVHDGRYYDVPQRHVGNVLDAFGGEHGFKDYDFYPGIALPDVQFELPGSYVVVNPDAHSCKRFDDALLHYVVDELVSAGRQVVVIGLKDQSGISNRPDVVSLVGKTTLMEAFAVIKNSAGFIGFDSGTSHVATAYGVPGLTFFPPKGARISILAASRGNWPYQLPSTQSNCAHFCRHYPSCPLFDCATDFGALRFQWRWQV